MEGGDGYSHRTRAEARSSRGTSPRAINKFTATRRTFSGPATRLGRRDLGFHSVEAGLTGIDGFPMAEMALGGFVLCGDTVVSNKNVGDGH